MVTIDNIMNKFQQNQSVLSDIATYLQSRFVKHRGDRITVCEDMRRNLCVNFSGRPAIFGANASLQRSDHEALRTFLTKDVEMFHDLCDMYDQRYLECTKTLTLWTAITGVVFQFNAKHYLSGNQPTFSCTIEWHYDGTSFFANATSSYYHLFAEIDAVCRMQDIIGKKLVEDGKLVLQPTVPAVPVEPAVPAAGTTGNE